MEHSFIRSMVTYFLKNLYFLTATKSEIERSLHQIINHCTALERLWQLFPSEVCKIYITPGKMFALDVQLYTVV